MASIQFWLFFWVVLGLFLFVLAGVGSAVFFWVRGMAAGELDSILHGVEKRIDAFEKDARDAIAAARDAQGAADFVAGRVDTIYPRLRQLEDRLAAAAAVKEGVVELRDSGPRQAGSTSDAAVSVPGSETLGPRTPIFGGGRVRFFDPASAGSALVTPSARSGDSPVAPVNPVSPAEERLRRLLGK